jgi:hypothetical protein
VGESKHKTSWQHQAEVFHSLAYLLEQAHACGFPVKKIGEFLWVTHDYKAKLLDFEVQEIPCPYTTHSVHKTLVCPDSEESTQVYFDKLF